MDWTRYKPKTARRVHAIQVSTANINDLAKELHGEVQITGAMQQQYLAVPTLSQTLLIPLDDYVVLDPYTGFIGTESKDNFEAEWDAT